MSPVRRAGAPRLIDWTGERCVPWAPDVQVVYEHFHRYLWAGRLVGGRRVLDLGSGEGFGAAILAESAAHVVGVEIDERTLEHSRLNYAGAGLEFTLGSAVDLSAFQDGSFGAVVAFEIIEHVSDQETVLAEIARVLDDDGILVISTPDRILYGEASDRSNPFHLRELVLEEFLALIGSRFPHVASWGQRTITGSHMNAVGGIDEESRIDLAGADFFIERAGDEWRIAGDPPAFYCVAVASKVPLPGLPASSTLSDCGVELLRVREADVASSLAKRDELREKLLLERIQAEHMRSVQELSANRREDIRLRDASISQRGIEISALQERVRALHEEVALANVALADAKQLNRRVEESVTWQAFQSLRGRLYGSIGESSVLARMLRVSLRLAGRSLFRRSKQDPPEAVAPEATGAQEPEPIRLSEHQNPRVSLIIPVHAHAELTRACLQSIRHHTTHVSHEVIIVDDAADPETKRLLESVHGANILHNKTNLGYLRSMNAGAKLARGEWLVLFNNDTEVTEGWLRAMLECAESADDVGVVTPKFLYPDGTLNEAGAIIWRDGTGMNYGRGDVPDAFQYEYRRETDYGSAAALMVNAQLWMDVGGFDERYLPMYYEDVDLCFEARERGLRVLYEPEATIFHREGATAGDAVTGHKRHQELNRPKFAAKWRRQLDAEQLREAPTNVRTAADRRRGNHVLVIDHHVPRWDRDAGSLRMLRIMQALLSQGAGVTFMPDNLAPIAPYTRDLQRMGIEVIYGVADVTPELAALGPRLTTAILSRPHPTARWLDLVREFAPAATVAYDTVDLHWLRESRRSALNTSIGAWTSSSNGRPEISSLTPKAEALRQLELAMIRATDLTLVVSDAERAQVQRDVTDAKVLVIPTAHEVEQYVFPPKDRLGILFLGGFQHPPNIDAAVGLVKEIMPAVWRELGDVRVTIAGGHAPPEVQALASPRVDVAGWVEDLRPLLEQSRLMVAPLRYGAGLKGKITQSLAAGLPVVTTPIGAEGFNADHGVNMLVGDGPAALAKEILRVCRDDDLWRLLSSGGQELIAADCSLEVLDDRVRELLAIEPVAQLV